GEVEVVDGERRVRVELAELQRDGAHVVAAEGAERGPVQQAWTDEAVLEELLAAEDGDPLQRVPVRVPRPGAGRSRWWNDHGGTPEDGRVVQHELDDGAGW